VGTYRKQAISDLPVEWTRIDLSDSSLVKKLLVRSRPDYVFHLASHVAGSRDPSLVFPTLYDNLVSTVNVLDAARKTGCRRIVLSNSVEEPERGDEHAVPSSPYAASKFAASMYGRMYHALYELPVVIARIFMVYGPAQKDLRKLVPYVILSLLKGEIPKLSSGVRLVDWIYVDDVVDGLLALARCRSAEGKTLDLGNGETFSVGHVVQQLFKLMSAGQEPEFGGIADRQMEQERFARLAQTTRITGWSPSISLEDGLARTIEWYKEHQAGT
jgi:nucleoside-diphosphate-sugar epimerase